MRRKVQKVLCRLILATLSKTNDYGHGYVYVCLKINLHDRAQRPQGALTRFEPSTSGFGVQRSASRSCIPETYPIDNNGQKKVQVGKDQEKAQSEKDSHSKNRCGKKPN